MMKSLWVAELKAIMIIIYPIFFAIFFYILTAIFNSLVFLGIGVLFVIYFFINGVYFSIKDNRPWFMTYKEIKQLEAFFEGEEIKDFVRNLFDKKYSIYKNIVKIAWEVEKRYDVELFFPKGSGKGSLKPGIFDKIYEVLGYTDIDRFWKKEEMK